MTKKINCPVCGRHEFQEWGDYDYCPICGWQNDPVQTRNENFWGGANKESLIEAREIYKKNGVYKQSVVDYLKQNEEDED